MQKSTFSFIIVLCFCIFSSINSFPFEKKLWIFWHDADFSKAPLLAQLCAQKIKISAQKAGFQFILLNQHTVKNYIKNYDERITKVRERSYQKGLMFLADLIRFHIIHEHGGIWMDITEILIDDFNWLINIQDEKYKHLIANRFSEQPDVLLFYFQGYQNAAQYHIKSPTKKGEMILYNQIPGYEIWFLAAKKNTPLMGQIKDTYIRFTQMPFSQIQSLFEKQDIYMNNEDVDGYLSANMAISYVLQRKQFELDKKHSIFEMNRYNVYQYYNLWSLSGLLGPLTWTNGDRVRVQNLMDKNMEYFKQKGSIFYFMVKLVGWTKNVIGQRIQLLQQLFKSKQFTIQKFISSKPTRLQCQKINFLVNGSVLYPIFQDSFYLKNETIKVISQQENEKWMQYCSQNYFDYQWKILPDLVNFFMMFSLDSLKIPWSRVHQTVNYNKKYQTLMQRINDFLMEQSTSIQFFLSLLANFLIGFLFCLIVIKYIWKKLTYSDIDGQSIQQQSYSLSNNKSQLKNYQSSTLRQKILLTFCLIFVWTMGLFLYFYIDFFGYRDDQLTILFGVIILILLQNFIESKINKFRSLKLFYETSYLYINFWLVYLCFSQTKKNKIWLIYCTFVTSLVGPLVIRLSKRMKTRNFILRKLVFYSSKNVLRYSLILFAAFMTVFSNIRYITYQKNYLVSFIPWIPTFVVGFLYIVALIECLKTKVQIQIFRTVMIGCLTLYLYFIAPLRNEVNGFNLQRIQWGFIVVAIYQTLFIQIGNDFIPRRNTRMSQKDQQSFKNQLKNLCALNLILFLEIFFGSFSHLWRIFDYGKLIVIEHLILVGNILIVSLYVKLKNVNQGHSEQEYQTDFHLDVHSEFTEIKKGEYKNKDAFNQLEQMQSDESSFD